LMGRMGRAYYVRASGDAVKTIVQPVMPLTIGYMELPESIRNSAILTANNLGQLAGIPSLPDAEAVGIFKNENEEITAILKGGNPKAELHQFAKRALDDSDDRDAAIKALLIGDRI
jgi:hypothetical protein